MDLRYTKNTLNVKHAGKGRVASAFSGILDTHGLLGIPSSTNNADGSPPLVAPEVRKKPGV
jgi:hypothetical protein